MTSHALWFRALHALPRAPFAAVAVVPALLVASPARADECQSDVECGLGFACETVVTSSASMGTAGVGGMAQGGTTSYGGASSFGGISGTGGTAGVSGAGGAPPPPACGNSFCETPTESPETCAPDCVYTTVCVTATCTNDLDCAPGYACPAPGSVGAGGGPSAIFCGDLICVAGETATGCPVDCDPAYRRCRPGTRSCVGNDDCGDGYVCFFGGAGGVGTGGVGGASAGVPPTGGVSGGFAEGGAPAEPPVTGGSAGVGGGSAGYAGAATGGGAGIGTGGGGNGIPQEGVCVPTGTTGGYGGVGGASSPTGGTINTGANSSRGGTESQGGTNGSDSDDEGDVVVTRGGCSLASPADPSPFAVLFVALTALLRFGRRRRTTPG